MTVKISIELEQKLIELCDGTRTRRTVAKETGLSYDYVRIYATRHPDLDMKFKPLLGNSREAEKSNLDEPESKTNDLLMQRW